MRGRTLVCTALMLALWGCRSPAGSPPQQAAPSLLEVSLPDLSRADEAVQVQARERHAALLEKIKAGVKGPELGAAYGELGMLLQAAEHPEAAEPCYRNAQTLMPADPRWPYYLGRLYQTTGRAPQSEAAFARVLELQPDDVPTLVQLGRMYLDRGNPGAAEPLFARARAASPKSVAALAGLGQTALANRQYERAVEYLEAGLAADPRALSLHSPLANAYRALGNLQKAESHLKQWRNTDVPLPDPRKEALDALLESSLSYELRGVRALNGQDWKGAAALFRKGIALSPPDSAMRRSLHHKLGTALWMLGDDRGAVAEFETVARLAPAEGVDESSAKAHYSLGIVLASSGRAAPAIEHLTAALRYQPSYAEAHLALADLLRGSRRFAEALPHYESAVRINPRSAQGRIGYAITLVRLGRDVEARDWLADAIRLQPDQPDLAHALARVLAAAPDDRARDGKRALEIAQQLSATQKTGAVAETLAMALAEVGQYQDAVTVQRGALDAARRAGQPGAAARVTANLRLYERDRPCRMPWRDDELQWPSGSG